MGASFSRWFFSFDIHELRNDLDDLIDRVDEMTLKLRECCQVQKNVREEHESLSKGIHTNKEKLVEVVSIADQMSALESSCKTSRRH